MEKRYRKDDDAIAGLTEGQRRVTQGDGTELAFSNAYWDNREPGLYDVHSSNGRLEVTMIIEPRS